MVNSVIAHIYIQVRRADGTVTGVRVVSGVLKKRSACKIASRYALGAYDRAHKYTRYYVRIGGIDYSIYRRAGDMQPTNPKKRMVSYCTYQGYPVSLKVYAPPNRDLLVRMSGASSSAYQLQRNSV